MIYEQVKKLLASDHSGLGLNELIDEFRGNRSVDEVEQLLAASEEDLIRIGAYILNEIGFEKYDKPSILSKLYQLVEHDSPPIRFYCLGALFPAFTPECAKTKAILAALRKDTNEGVRMSAEAATSQLLKCENLQEPDSE